MQASREVTAGLNYLLPSNYPSPYNPSNYNINPTFQNLQRLSNQLFGNNNFHNINHIHHDFTSPPQSSSCISSNSTTSDEADDQHQQLMINNERKHRRMISNRESARRSRMRKQKHLDELWSQVVWLRNENHQLVDKLNHVSESHDQVLQENVQLKEEASELRQMIRDMQIHSPPCNIPSFTNITTTLLEENNDDVNCCSSEYLRSDSSNNQSISRSMDLLG